MKKMIWRDKNVKIGIFYGEQKSYRALKVVDKGWRSDVFVAVSAVSYAKIFKNHLFELKLCHLVWAFLLILPTIGKQCECNKNVRAAKDPIEVVRWLSSIFWHQFYFLLKGYFFLSRRRRSRMNVTNISDESAKIVSRDRSFHANLDFLLLGNLCDLVWI